MMHRDLLAWLWGQDGDRGTRGETDLSPAMHGGDLESGWAAGSGPFVGRTSCGRVRASEPRQLGVVGPRAHGGEDGYDLQRHVDDPSALSEVVAFDAPYLGDLAGQRVVHLQRELTRDTQGRGREVHTGDLPTQARQRQRVGADVAANGGRSSSDGLIAIG